MWNGRDCGASQVNHTSHTKGWSHPKKVMLYIWWDWKGVVYNELLQENQMINSNTYCSQLDHLKAAANKKHQN